VVVKVDHFAMTKKINKRERSSASIEGRVGTIDLAIRPHVI